MKLALREEMTPGETLPERLAWLERLGFDGIELTGPSLELPPEEVRLAFAGSPVQAATVGGVSTLIDLDPDVRATAMDTMRSRIELCASLGAVGVLLVPQFGRTPSLPDLEPVMGAAESERELFRFQLRALAGEAEAAGVTIFLEPLNRYEAYMVTRLEHGLDFADRLQPCVKIMADFFHMNIEEADIAASIRQAAEHIVYVHVADSNRLQPGRGHLDFKPGFAALKEAGYDGYLGIECRVAGPFDDALTESMAFLRDQWAAA
ncbi:MAG: sugar phosphate isomerase/epimerase [Chloroflexia bacterium]|nr:sugar phosphate isomerase/epimerase [Chloroflexia bacterium]